MHVHVHAFVDSPILEVKFFPFFIALYMGLVVGEKRVYRDMAYPSDPFTSFTC